MQSLTVFLEWALIVALGVVWWLARRDLQMLVTRQQTPTLREMESIQATIERLLERLEARTDEAERRSETCPHTAPDGAGSIPSLAVDIDSPAERTGAGADPTKKETVSGEADSAARYVEVHRLAAAGLDADEIARRTGLGSGEVRLVLSLHSGSSGTAT